MLKRYVSKQSEFRVVAGQLEDTAKKLNNEWRSSKKPPFNTRSIQNDKIKPYQQAESVSSDSPTSPLHSSSSSSESTRAVDSSRVPVQNAVQTQSRQQMYTSSNLEPQLAANCHQSRPPLPSSPEGDLHEVVIDMLRTLGQRGTGHHICPYGRACVKGGYEGGVVKVFERNSAFRFVH
jgi:hypothetical protein